MTNANIVIDIFELATLIANGLTQHDLAICCRVNTHWFNAFTQHLWHSIIIQRRDAIPKFKTPEGRAGLLRNGHHIRVLCTATIGLLRPILEYGTTCVNLTCLDAQHGPENRVKDYVERGTRTMAFEAIGRTGKIEQGQRQSWSAESKEESTDNAIIGFEAQNAILMPILKRNPKLQYLIVPFHCFRNEAFVKVVAESLPVLKEFYSSSDLTSKITKTTSFSLTAPLPFTDSSLQDVPQVSGCLQSTTQLTMPLPTLEPYPKLVEMRQGILARINQDALKRIKSADKEFTWLSVDTDYSEHIIQILMETPLLTGFVCAVSGYLDQSIIPAFLRHVSTLEYIEFKHHSVNGKILEALLCSCPHLNTLRALDKEAEFHSIELNIDARSGFEKSWACENIEVLECRIVKVPRPDLIINSAYDASILVFLPPLQTAANMPSVDALSDQIQTAQRQSHALQRKILQQLGRLTHLRSLVLGCRESRYGIRALQSGSITIIGANTIAMDRDYQRECLELSLESGLEELAGLRELEVLDVTDMIHRIGPAEQKWLFSNLPKLKHIHGL
ncbi:hypothetical protein FBU30_008143 [Linnemannia zychae]|nr:hypothetical protein FBU30_008143 [Linnemannia zychae]